MKMKIKKVYEYEIEEEELLENITIGLQYALSKGFHLESFETYLFLNVLDEIIDSKDIYIEKDKKYKEMEEKYINFISNLKRNKGVIEGM